MTNTFCRLVIAVGLLVGQVAAAAEPAGTPPGREHRDTLASYRTAQVRAYLEGNSKDMLAYLADSVRLMPGYQKTVLGKSDATTYHQAFLTRFTVSAYERQVIEAVDLGSRVMEIGHFTMTLAEKDPAGKGAAEAHTLAGKYMDLWEKTSAGKLVLLTAAWNYDQLPKIADKLRFAEVPAVHMALQPRVPVSVGISLELAAIARLKETAIIQHDGKTWSLFYADDAILLSNHGAPVSGRKALDEHLVPYARALPIFEKLDLRTDKIDDLGKYVIEYASAIAIYKVDGYAGVNLGKNIIVWRRAENGALQVWRAIGMYD